MRFDGRQPAQLRAPYVQFRTVPRAHGSAEFGLGDETCIACVYGPVSKKSRREIDDRARIEVLYKSSCSRATPRERNHELQIKRYLEKIIDATQYPRTTLKIVVHPARPEIGELVSSHALNSALFALLDAGVALRTTCFAVSIGLRQDDGQLVVDPVAEELPELGAQLTVGVDLTGQLTYASQTSFLSETKWTEAVDLATRSAKVLEAFLRLAMKESCHTL